MRLRQRSGQMAGYEFLIILVCVVVIVAEGFVIWHLLKSQNADNSFFEKGSNPIVVHHEPNIHPICGIIFDYNDRGKNANTSSSSNSAN